MLILSVPFMRCNWNYIKTQADEHGWKDCVIIDAPSLFLGKSFKGFGNPFAIQADCVVSVVQDHGSAQDRSLPEIIGCGFVRSQPIKGRVNRRAVITFTIVLKNQLPIGSDIIGS